MKCSDINRILDEHSLFRLSPAERSGLNAHLVDCSACVESVAAYEVLRDEPAARPAPGLLTAIVDRIPSGKPRPIRRTAPIGWQAVGGLAAMGAVVMIAVFSAIGQRAPEESAPAGVVAPNLTADTLEDTSGQRLPPGQVPIPVSEFMEGEHFVALPSGLESVEALDRVTAWIFYMWSCLHCYEFEAALSEWIAQQDPDAVDVVRVPVQWNPVVILHARAHYTAELLGISGRASEAFFEAIHERGESLASRAEIAALFARLGIDQAAFDTAFDSDRVSAELERGQSIAERFRIDSTPTIVVDGRYMTSPGLAGSHEQTTAVLDSLVARASAERLRVPGQGQSEVCYLARIASLDRQIEAATEALEELNLQYDEQHPRVRSAESRLRQMQGRRADAIGDCGSDGSRDLFR